MKDPLNGDKRRFGRRRLGRVVAKEFGRSDIGDGVLFAHPGTCEDRVGHVMLGYPVEATKDKRSQMFVKLED